MLGLGSFRGFKAAASLPTGEGDRREAPLAGARRLVLSVAERD